MAVNDYYWELAELNPDAVVYEEFESAYLGMAIKTGLKPVAIYDSQGIINTIGYSLMQDKEFVKTLEQYENEEDEVDAVYTAAVEHFDVNIAAATFGDNNENGPIFLEMPDENFDERIEEDG